MDLSRIYLAVRPALAFASHCNFPNDTTNSNTTHPIITFLTQLRKNSEKRGREAGGPKTAVKPSSAYCKHRKICLESKRERAAELKKSSSRNNCNLRAKTNSCMPCAYPTAGYIALHSADVY